MLLPCLSILTLKLLSLVQCSPPVCLQKIYSNSNSNSQCASPSITLVLNFSQFPIGHNTYQNTILS